MLIHGAAGFFRGADRINGNAAADILIAGTFMDGASQEDRRAALLAIRKEWSSADSYQARVANLDAVIRPCVADDQAVDKITGASGSDWFFATLSGQYQGQVTDLHNGGSVDGLSS